MKKNILILKKYFFEIKSFFQCINNTLLNKIETLVKYIITISEFIFTNVTTY